MPGPVPAKARNKKHNSNEEDEEERMKKMERHNKKFFLAPLLSVRFDAVPYEMPVAHTPNPHVLCPAPSEKSWSNVESKFQTGDSRKGENKLSVG